MGVFNQILQFLLSLSILVILHEFGHFIFARIFKTRVEKFYLFFNPWFSIFKYKKGETEYGLGWLPLGGYVKISGMIDESMDKEQLKKEPEPWEFRSKPAWQRFLIIFGGVLVNFILAVLIYSMALYTWGEQYLPTKNAKYGISCDNLAEQIGFKNGDIIVSVEGKEVESFMQIAPTIVLEKAEWVTVLRDSQLVDVKIDPSHIPQLLKTSQLFLPRVPLQIAMVSSGSAADSANFKVGDKLHALNGESALFFDQFKTVLNENRNKQITVTMNRDGELVDLVVRVPESGVVGIQIAGLEQIFELKVNEYNFFQSFPAGINRGVKMIDNYLKQLKLVFSPKTKAYESVGGFITIGSIFPKLWDWQAFWDLTALISIILAIMNILPIPALDGGHMLFIVYEMLSGRKPSDKFLEYAQIAGMIVILALVLFANANDVIKLFR